MPTITVNDQTVDVPAGITLIQACELAGVEIPRFCYHDRLAIAGNCRMCLVELEKAPKPVASCAMPVGDGMVVRTNSELVKKAREGVMEFLLINHPLDCPICDQGGECDLQDQAMSYGGGSSAYKENKRAVAEKYMGPLIKTTMTRCIHCTRCVRFSEDVAGVPALGAVGRGENMEITTLEKAVASELSANVIDLCPVGALTSRPYAFNARPWELRKTESIDVLDGLGSNIRVDTKGAAVLRVLPRLNEDINEEWISDKTRYACDGLQYQRLDTPYVRVDGTLQATGWDKALEAVKEEFGKHQPNQIAAIAGGLADVETQFLLRQLLDSLRIQNRDCRTMGSQLNPADRSGYIMNSGIAGLDEADAVLIIGGNPRKTAPILNARIRKQVVERKIPVAFIGEEADLTYPYEHLGDSTSVLETILNKQSFKSEKPFILIDESVFSLPDANAITATLGKIADLTGAIKEGWNGYNVLHHTAGRVGGLDIGFVPGEGGMDTKTINEQATAGNIKVLYLLNCDELDQLDPAALKSTTVIYQGHHGDRGASLADIILPGSAYTEKTASYVNTEGRWQRTQQANAAPGQAKEDWKIIRVLSEVLGKPLPVNTLPDVIAALQAAYPTFAAEGQAVPAEWQSKGTPGPISKTVLPGYAVNFYQTDTISRASKTMAECVKAFANNTDHAAPVIKAA